MNPIWGSLFYWFEILLRSATNGTHPVIREIFKWCSCWNIVIWIPLSRIINIPTNYTSVLLHLHSPFKSNRKPFQISTNFCTFHLQGHRKKSHNKIVPHPKFNNIYLQTETLTSFDCSDVYMYYFFDCITILPSLLATSKNSISSQKVFLVLYFNWW